MRRCGHLRQVFPVCKAGIIVLFVTALTFGQTTAPSNKLDEIRQQRLRAEQWFLNGRLMPGATAAALRYRAYQQKMRMRAGQQIQGPGSPQISTSGWAPLGPAPLASDASGIGLQDYNWVSGRATAVAIDPADATGNTVYVGGAYGGVWKSTNALQSPSSVVWNALIDNQATLAVGAIAIQPQLTNPNPAQSVVLVGTGEANSSSDSYYGLGILRSADAGNTWTLTSQDTTGTLSFQGIAFSKIAFSTASPNLAVAASANAQEGVIEGLATQGTSNLGLYYSTDSGVSWTYATVQDAALADAKRNNLSPAPTVLPPTYGTDGQGNPTASVTVQYQFNMISSYLGFSNVNLSRTVTMPVHY